jgi:hypothetical protein
MCVVKCVGNGFRSGGMCVVKCVGNGFGSGGMCAVKCIGNGFGSGGMCVVKCVGKLPGVGPDAEGEDVVNPVFWVTIVYIFARDGFVSGETIWSCVFFSWDMNESEVKQEDCCDPAVYGCIWLHVGVTQHAFDELRIHLYN